MEPIVDAALTQLGMDIEFETISDARDIVKHGVMNAPALLVNGEVKISGRIPTVDEVVEVIQASK
ncbi:MAG: redox-active disulfide protein 2 [Anaerosolibacter sp.]|jgi:alkyl hydroperoxide reductase subunit AhpF|uniref:thioredoxin family protein n=1 Tax=Anaerosolibacter sp. TaxID=1872527 RepID=UPI00261AA4BA|nr:thioredoxin family protein [Anaerosolibacter sp.]MDF2547872.1 redox-active disulfide protein 2 [Anaerosolibacter sp.]